MNYNNPYILQNITTIMNKKKFSRPDSCPYCMSILVKRRSDLGEGMWMCDRIDYGCAKTFKHFDRPAPSRMVPIDSEGNLKPRRVGNT